MRKAISVVTTLLLLLLVAHTTLADSTWEYSVQVSATVQASPAQITLTWPQDVFGAPASYTVYRKAAGATSWGSGTALPGSTTTYVDSNVSVGTAYEYQVVKAASGYTGYGYIYAGINVPMTDNRGKLLLVVDNTYASSLAGELTRLQQDLVGDGWTVIRQDVGRNDSVTSVKSWIKSQYNADSANVKMVFLFGHVPVPYSGNIVPDGHVPDHQGAWPCDAFYGDMDGTWTDNSVNVTSAEYARNDNVPGDGKYDQSTFPAPIKLMVGRVDLANMPGLLWTGGPTVCPSELELLRNYLNKDHKFRTKQFDLPRRGIVGDYFGDRNGEAFGASAYRNFAPFFGANNITKMPNQGTWAPALKSTPYLWAGGFGAGSFSSIGGLSTSGVYNDLTTPELVTNDLKFAFGLFFGSWLGDWDSQDNIMRGVLALPSYGLACAWSGRPHWFLHHMGLGEPIGYGARLSQNNGQSGLYQNQVNTAAGQIHPALMGDPTLRLFMVSPPANITASTNGSSIALSWTTSSDSVLGYHVYRADSNGVFTRLTSTPVSSTSYTDSSASGAANYMVRAVKLETSSSGTYYNPSQGAFLSTAGITNGSTGTTTNTPPSDGGTTTNTPPSSGGTTNTPGGSSLSNLVSWVDEALPTGATGSGDGGDTWNWISSNPTPVSGSRAHQSATAAGLHQHYFTGATSPLKVNTGEILFAYVYVDPANPPSELMLQWFDGSSWEHRAYWGANAIPYGITGTASRSFMGALPTSGQWVCLQVPASQVGLEGSAITGMAFSQYGGRATWDNSGKSATSITNTPPSDGGTTTNTPPSSGGTTTNTPPSSGGTTNTGSLTNVVAWIDDALPTGAAGAGDSGDGWNWVSSNPAPFRGSRSHQSSLGSGLHQHYFTGATSPLKVSTGESLFAYVYLDPANPPSEIMLQWFDGSSWEHRAYWGANNILYGIYGTASRAYLGALPAAGQWVCLQVPASQVGLEGSTITGMAFSQYNGRATWDYTGKSATTLTNPPSDGGTTTNTPPSDGGSTTNTPPSSGGTSTTTSSLTLAWNPSASSNIAGYRIYEGVTSKVYTNTIDVGNKTSLTVSGLVGGVTYYFAASAYDNAGVESNFSNEISYTAPVSVPPSSTGVPVINFGDTNAPSGSNTNGSGTGGTTTTNTPPVDGTVTNPPTTGGTNIDGTVTNSPTTGNTNSTAITTNSSGVSLIDYVTPQLPQIGDNTLHVLTPTLLELKLINTKQLNDAQVSQWNLVNSSFQFNAPATSAFTVSANGQTISVSAVGFKRRPLYAPLAAYDLRIENSLYLQLSGPISDNQTIEVTNPNGSLWPSTMKFVATVDPLRYSPAIHVNQEGYMPNYSKKGMVGYYIGNLGELSVPSSAGFKLVDANTGAQVYQGTLVQRSDVGFSYNPTPYQKVYEADFTGFNTPGEYRLVVPGMGGSLPFMIDSGIAMNFARAYALGLYHQRCGTNTAMPYTRHTHDVCHAAPAAVPASASTYAFTWNTIAGYANTINQNNPPQAAPALTSPSAQLFPFQNQGPVEASGGHHDAGDYSKYTANSASLVHYLMFAVDSLPGVAALDNLGIPESGDGISDVMQEAKWEADFLAKIQDSDGGFYFLVYPQNREYESGVTPDHGDPQVVWPKTTSVTAASVAALAQCATSPLFKQTYPQAAALYLQKAKLGWQFLTNAIAKYGKTGAYQKITHYSDNYTDKDELAWAACQMYLATGDDSIHKLLLSWFDPSDPATFRWGWWRMSECYGHAIRSYAFAAQTGRATTNQLDATFLSKCQAQITCAADDTLNWSKQSAYGTSFPNSTKSVRGAGWYFSTDQAFDVAVGYQLNPKADYMTAMLANMNYEGGCNPLNVSYITGVGWKRQRDIVSQWAVVDTRVLPPSGIPVGNIQAGYSYLAPYGASLQALCFPSEDATTAPYPYYDRWGDSWNVNAEMVVLNQSRSMGTLAFLAAQTPTKSQAWKAPANAKIVVPSTVAEIGSPVTLSLQVPGMDLSSARITWEGRDQEPAFGSTFAFVPQNNGSQWVEAEAQWPDGRRAFAKASFSANSTNIVWVNDAIPAGATTGADGGDSWKWVSSNPAPYAGTLAHQSAIASGEHQHYFTGASSTLVIGTGDVLYAYVYIDPANPPTELMLQWCDGTWDHRAYWGANSLYFGADGTASRRYMGPLPAAGQWVQLKVPASEVGLEGSTLTGMAFTAYGGRVTWDAAGRLSTSTPPATGRISPTLTANASGVTLTWASVAGATYQVSYKDSLADTSWTFAAQVTSGGSPTSWTDTTAPGSQRFYQVMQTN